MHLTQYVPYLVVGLFTIAGTIIGGAMTFFFEVWKHRLDKERENEIILREKMEEAYKRLISIVTQLSSEKAEIMNMQKGLYPTEYSSDNGDPPELHLNMLLSLYSQDFDDYLDEFRKTHHRYSLDMIKLADGISARVQGTELKRLQDSAIESAGDLMDLCTRIRNRILNIFEKELRFRKKRLL